MKNRKKFLNKFIAFFTALAILLSNGVFIGQSVQATEDDSLKNATDIFRDELKNSRQENQHKELDKVPLPKDVENDEQLVTLIVQLNEKALKDYNGQGKKLADLACDKELVDKVLKSQESYKNKIKYIDKDVKFKREFTLLLNGFSLETKYKYKEDIEAIEGVKHVTLAKKYTKEMTTAIDSANVSKVWKDYGYDGKGMVIAIIDSGIDYTHKDMVLSKGGTPKLTKEKIDEMNKKSPKAKGQYFTEKVPYGYNFADNDIQVIDKAEGGSGYMHGMHVAGIAGANCQSAEEIKNGKGIKGVAPECQLLAMKIFSNNKDKADALEDTIVNAIEDSIAHGADVINMSFGSPAGFQDVNDGQQVAVNEAIKNGIIVVSAAGNSYYSTYPKKYKDIVDTGVLGSPGLAEGTIQVASYENDFSMSYALDYKVKDKSETLDYKRFRLDPISLKGEYELVDCELGIVSEEKAVDQFKDKKLGSNIALVKVGEIDINEKALNAAKNGAKAVIVYDDEKDSTNLEYLYRDLNIKIPVVFLKNAKGLMLKSLIDQGLKISFNGKVITTANDEKGEISSFSSWGPTPNLDLKPDITSIGGFVYSTVNTNSYEYMSGTSMSSPLVAGATALLLQHIDKMGLKFDKLEEKVNFAKLLLMNTAKVNMEKNGKIPYSPRRQGAGIMDIDKALKNKVTVTFDGKASAALKSVGNKTDFSLKLHNYGDKPLTYKIDVVGGVLTEQNKDIVDMTYDIPMEDATISFQGGNSITVNPGEDAIVKVSLNMGDKAPKNAFAEGFIRFTPADINSAAVIGMPFMGFYGQWAGLNVLDVPDYEKGSILKETSLFTAKQEPLGYKTYYLGGKDHKPEYFSINPNDANANNNVVPQIAFLRNAKELKIDVTDEKGNVVKVIDERKNIKKEVISKQRISSKIDFNWLWEGKVYDKEKGEKVSIAEGQYFINIRAKADCEGAKEQVITMPIKIDQTSPKVNLKDIVIADSLDYKLEFQATDEKGSGVEKFLFLVNNKKYEDKDGNKIFRLQKDEKNNKYVMNLQLPKENKGSMYTVNIGATDYADNMAIGATTIIYPAKSNIEIEKSSSTEEHNVGEDITLNYKLKNGLDEKDIHHYEIVTDNMKNTKDNGKNLSYVFKGDLGEGEHFIAVKAVDSKGKILDINAIKIAVKDNKEKTALVIKDITEKPNFIKGEEANIKYKISNHTDASKKVCLILALYDDKEAMINYTVANKEINKGSEEVLEGKLNIPKEGNYKLKTFLWDSLDSMKPLGDYTEKECK